MMNSEKLELYIHIPFCVSKCAYCDFLSAPGETQIQREYVDCLLKEIKSHKDKEPNAVVDTIFIGGGTPSILPEGCIRAIMNQVKETFTLGSQVEITIEANPGTLTKEKLIEYLSAGINRLSIGLQSVNNKELKELGRIHTFEDFLTSYELAVESGFQNINIDLMSALPRQTLESWEKTLRQVTDLNPNHISAYSLIIEEGTPFYSKYSKAGENMLPDEDLERELYYFTKSYLQEKGYERYEISNYAKKDYECRHNIGYWTGIQYLGMGLGASSYMRESRFKNPVILSEYIENCEELYKLSLQSEKLTMAEQMEEFMFLGLRLLAGVSIDEFRERFHKDIFEIYGMVIEELVKDGLLCNNGKSIYLTERGLDLSNYVMMRFLL